MSLGSFSVQVATRGDECWRVEKCFFLASWAQSTTTNWAVSDSERFTPVRAHKKPFEASSVHYHIVAGQLKREGEREREKWTQPNYIKLAWWWYKLLNLIRQLNWHSPGKVVDRTDIETVLYTDTFGSIPIIIPTTTNTTTTNMNANNSASFVSFSRQLMLPNVYEIRCTQ